MVSLRGFVAICGGWVVVAVVAAGGCVYVCVCVGFALRLCVPRSTAYSMIHELHGVCLLSCPPSLSLSPSLGQTDHSPLVCPD